MGGSAETEGGTAVSQTVPEALRKAIRQVFGNDVPVQRCVQHYPDLRVIPTSVDKGP
jgi:hypothetical protein